MLPHAQIICACTSCFRDNGLGRDWWKQLIENDLFTRLQRLNGEDLEEFNCDMAKLKIGQLETLQLQGTGLFYVVLDHLEKGASRLKVLDLRWGCAEIDTQHYLQV